MAVDLGTGPEGIFAVDVDLFAGNHNHIAVGKACSGTLLDERLDCILHNLPLVLVDNMSHLVVEDTGNVGCKFGMDSDIVFDMEIEIDFHKFCCLQDIEDCLDNKVVVVVGRCPFHRMEHLILELNSIRFLPDLHLFNGSLFFAFRCKVKYLELVESECLMEFFGVGLCCNMDLDIEVLQQIEEEYLRHAVQNKVVLKVISIFQFA